MLIIWGVFMRRFWHIPCEGMSVAIIVTIMKIAIPLCRQRVAPLFETAETFLMISHDNLERKPTLLETRQVRIEEKCRQLYADGTRVLLCGALSRQWRNYLQQLGIKVRAFLAGDAQEIMHAYMHGGEGGLDRYAMPGCKRGRRRSTTTGPFRSWLAQCLRISSTLQGVILCRALITA